MKPKGYIVNYSNAVTLDTDFILNDTTYVSSYIYIATAGDLVWMNSDGQLNFIENAQAGYHPINATQIVTSGSVGGVSQATGASEISWFASNFP